MAAETQTLLDALGAAEWFSSMLLELWLPGFRLEAREQWFPRMPSLAVCDAKDVYDHVRGANPSSGLKDLRAAADVVIYTGRAYHNISGY